MKHFIKNYDELGITEFRRAALDILEAGYEAILTKNAISGTIQREGKDIRIKNFVFRISDYERIFFLGIGKCAADAAEAIEPIIGDKLTDGIAIDVKAGNLKKIRSFIGDHPYPSDKSVAAAKEAVKMLSHLTEKDLVILVVSGGGSSLFSLPHKISPETLTAVTKALMDKGAPINELNIVRKHLSEVQGGFLAKQMYPAQSVALLFSDVPGNDIGTIASGPTVLDKSTKGDAEEILEKYEIRVACGLPDLDLVETPKEEKYFSRTRNILAVTNDLSLEAMSKKAVELGYYSVICTSCARGEARDFGKRAVMEERTPHGCFLYGGETTVTIAKQGGTGGRNQEAALGALMSIRENMLFAAAASDGWDNSDCAGAIADLELLRAAENKGMKPEEFLASNNSFEFFSKAGGHIKTGKTGANVADLYLVLTK